MKTALLLAGHFREILYCFPSLKEQIIDVYNPDIFISCWNSGGDFSSSVNAYTYKLEETATINDVIGILKPKFIKSEDFDSAYVNTIKNKAWDLDVYGPMTGETNPVSIFCMWYKIKSACKLMQEYEEQVGEKYDLIIKGRFDINIHDPLIITNSETISIPPGYDWRKGINDIFAYGGREAMLHYCSMFNFIESYIIRDRVFFHPETLLKHHLFQSGFGVERPNVRVSLRNNNIWEHEVVPDNFKKL